MQVKTLNQAKIPGVPSTPWIVRHWQQALLALGAVIVAVLLTVWVTSRLTSSRERGWESLSMAMNQVAQGHSDQAAKILDSLLGSQRSGPLAVQALLMKGDLLSAQGKTAEALASVREAQRQAVSPEYKALVSIALGNALERAGQSAQAAEQYAAFIAEFPDHFLVPRAYSELARIQAVSGKAPEARATYEKLITLYPATVWAQNAKAALESLRGKG